MEVLFEKVFEKDLRKLKDKAVKRLVKQIILEVKKAASQQEVPNLVKLHGFKNYYRMRVGVYRIGVEIKERKMIFVRFLHRKDIYKYFP